MGLLSSFHSRRGFALPTVLIASVVLLIVLAVSVTATTSARNALKDQYYAQLAQVAGEAGVAYAQACLQANNNTVTWSDANPLTPGTDCTGTENVNPVVSALVVGGGGGGGANGGGGGGAGGYQYSDTLGVSVQSYAVTVGTGGAAAASNSVEGSNGGNSVFNGLTANGGGGGASRDGGNVGQNGGSGGGGAGSAGSGREAPGTGIAGQGNDGGMGTPADLGCNAGGGGGGGAGTDGSPGLSQQAGNAGTGLLNSITGTAVFYAVGGPGGPTCAPGQAGIGATGGSSAGVAPPANTGGGGAGGGASGAAQAGADGVVIISYPQTAGITATGGTITNENGNVIHRFTSNGTFQVTAASASCPGNNKCWVAIQENIRSGFSVPEPELDSDGRPVSIPQTGFVEIWRESTGTTWRAYRQPSAQSAVVPALCSGAARSDLGWSNAAIATATGTFISTTARPINISSGNSAPGPIQYRKDFNIVEGGTYTIQAKGDDRLKLYVDGALVMQTTTDNETGSVNVTLTPGCHVLHATVTNLGLATSTANLILSMKKQNQAKELIVSDASWRVSAGTTAGFATNRYYASSSWVNNRDIAAYNGAPWSEPTGWTTTTADTTARWISLNVGYSGTNYPFASYGYLRTKKDNAWTFNAATEIQLSISCDDSCTVYIDGNPVLNGSVGLTATSKVTLAPGQHSLGIELYNGGASNNPTGLLFSARRTSDNVVIDRSDTNWWSTNAWYSSTQTLQSYDETFHPSPDTFDCNCATQGTTNLILNPSIESNTTGYTNSLLTLTRSTAADNNGSWGLQGTVSGLGTMPRAIYSTTQFEVGQTYAFSAYVAGTVDMRLAYQFKDATGTAIPINGSTIWYTTPVNPNSTTVFARLSASMQPVPAQTKTIELWVGAADNTPTSTVVYIDDLMLSPGSLVNYGDGTFTGWRWLGTSNASVSSGTIQ